MTVTIEHYCANICGAKCCNHPTAKMRCPHCNDSNRCNIYAARFADDQPDSQLVGIAQQPSEFGADPELIYFNCTRIKKLIERGLLPKEIEAQCCIAHPELLDDGNKNS